MDKWADVAAAEGEEGFTDLWSATGGSCALDCRGWLIWGSERKRRWWCRVLEGPREPLKGCGLTGGRGFIFADFLGWRMETWTENQIMPHHPLKKYLSI